MSAPLLWIILPIGIASITFFLHRWQRITTSIIASFSIVLAVFAWLVPIGEQFIFGPVAFILSDRVVFAGRQFLLESGDRSMLIVVYLSLALILVLSRSGNVDPVFSPVSLALCAFLIASVAVVPFLYAALFIQVAVLLGVLLVAPPGKIFEKGVLRYLTLMTLGLPFMLFGGWALSEIDPSVATSSELLPALVFLGFGFSFLLAIFPLNSWIPMLAERSHSFAVIVILFYFPQVVISLLLRFLTSFSWLLELEVIRFLGLLMVVTGGGWIAFQRDLGRIFGYALIIEIGRSILIISQPGGMEIYNLMVIPRLLTLLIWGLSLALIRKHGYDLKFRTVQGFGRIFPLPVIGLLVAQFSFAGFPLMAGFPVLLILLERLVQASALIALLTLMSSLGMLVSGLRTLAVVMMGPEELPQIEPSYGWVSRIWLILGVSALLIGGLFPHWFISLSEVITSVGN